MSPQEQLTRLWSAPRAELEQALATGFAIEPEALAGKRYRGVSLGLGRLVERLTWKVFCKAFESEAGGVAGYNVRLEQPRRVVPLGAEGAEPVIARQRGGQEERFGPFGVRPLAPSDRLGTDQGLVLDYGLKHPALHPMKSLRDPLVALERGGTDLLLGASFVALGPFSLRTPSYFTLERID